MSILKVAAIQNAAGVEVYTAKAWVNFNGTGTVAIQAAGNVSSITDLGTGSYALNFGSAMPDAFYSTLGSVNSGGMMDLPGATNSTKTTTRLDVNTRTNTGALSDVSSASIAIFR